MITLYSQMQERINYNEWREELNKFIKLARRVLGSSSEKSFETRINEHMRNFDLSKEDAKYCVDCGERLVKEYSLLPQILSDEFSRKTDWKTTKRRVEALKSRADIITTQYFGKITPQIQKNTFL